MTKVLAQNPNSRGQFEAEAGASFTVATAANRDSLGPLRARDTVSVQDDDGNGNPASYVIINDIVNIPAGTADTDYVRYYVDPDACKNTIDAKAAYRLTINAATQEIGWKDPQQAAPANDANHEWDLLSGLDLDLKLDGDNALTVAAASKPTAPCRLPGTINIKKTNAADTIDVTDAYWVGGPIDLTGNDCAIVEVELFEEYGVIKQVDKYDAPASTGGVNPATSAQARYWFDPSLGPAVGYTLDGGTGNVQSFIDQRSTGDAVAATAANQPTLGTSINGLQTVQFDAANKELYTPVASTVNAPYTAFVVWQHTLQQNFGGQIFTVNNSSGDAFGAARVGATRPFGLAGRNDTHAANHDHFTANLNVTKIAVIRYGTADVSVRILNADGTDDEINTDASLGAAASQDRCVIGTNVAGTQDGHFRWCEGGVLTGTLTTADEEDILTYLKNKWG